MHTGRSGISRRAFGFGIAAAVLPSIGMSTESSLANAPAGPPMEAEEAQALAQQYADAQAAKDPDAIVALFFDDGVYVDTQNSSNGTRQGHDQIGEYFRQVYHSYPDLVFTIDAIAAHTPIQPSWSMLVGVMWTFNGVHAESSEVAGEGTNQQILISGYDQLAISRGQDVKPRIVSAYSYYDGQSFAAQDQAG